MRKSVLAFLALAVLNISVGCFPGRLLEDYPTNE